MRTFIIALVFFAVGISGGYYLWALNGVGEIEHALGKPIPLPPQLAPATQKSAALPLSESDIASGIIGQWQSLEEEFSREFSVDASVLDSYLGSAPETIAGRWAVFTAPEGEKPPFPVAPGTVYLRISNPEEVMYFKVTELTRNSLELSYLDGNGVQKFERK